MKRDLPVYELLINEDTDAIVSAISLVDAPAIESNFLAFKEDKQVLFNSDEDKMELLGAAMIPNQRIYRIDKTTGKEFEVFFSKETIRKIAQQYFKLGFQKNMNINHTSIPANSYIFQSYLVDDSKGITAPKGIDAPDGSLIIGVKVEDAEVWQQIKQGKVKGFSIEGVFEFLESKFSQQHNEENEDAEVYKLLQQINHIITRIKK